MDLVTGPKTWESDGVSTLKILHRAKGFSAATDSRGCLYAAGDRKPVTLEHCFCLLIDLAAQLGRSGLED